MFVMASKCFSIMKLCCFLFLALKVLFLLSSRCFCYIKGVSSCEVLQIFLSYQLKHGVMSISWAFFLSFFVVHFVFICLFFFLCLFPCVSNASIGCNVVGIGDLQLFGFLFMLFGIFILLYGLYKKNCLLCCNWSLWCALSLIVQCKHQD